MSTTFYSNTINYSQQAAGRTYNTFATPLDSNKILLYITSISIVATGWDIIWGYYPVNLNVSSRILTSNTYSLSVSLSIYVAVAKLQFSMILFNADDVQSSKKYVIVYDVWQTDELGGFIQVPSAFVDNFILGLTDFSTMDGKCVIVYQWSFATVSGKYGVQLALSQPVNNNYDCALSRMKSTVFYMKTWQCPQANPYFNLTTNLCQDGCGTYFYPNSSVYQCQDCEWSCAKCVNSTFCTGCDSTNDFRTLKNISGKANCVCMVGYFQDPSDPSNKKCLSCIANCLTCNSSTVCQVCDVVAGYILTTDKKCKKCGYGCLSCNQTPYVCLQCTMGMVYDSALQKCVCLTGTYPSNSSVTCLSCSPTCGACSGPSSSQCTNCSSKSSTPFYNSTTRQCQSTCGEYFFEDWLIFNCSLCPVGCNRCSSSKNCTQCDLNTNKRSLVALTNEVSSCPCIQGYYQDTKNTKNNVCLQCNISNCLACNSSTVCTLCRNLLPGYALTSTGRCVTTCGYGCLSCNDTSSRCLTCETGFVLSSTSRCNCLPGTFSSNTNVSCIACHPKCKTCTGPSEFNCTSCPTTNTTAPYFNFTTTSCQETCGLYFFENLTAFECQRCLFNCKDCATSPECTECDLQNHFRKLISRNGQKTCSCIVGYYQDPQNTTNPICKKCIENCLTCRDNSTCDACNEANGYILSANKTCIACGFGCVSCSEATLSCTRCKPQFDLDPSTNQCLCPSGTVKAVGSITCTSCHPTCKSCNGPTQYECTNCSSQQNRISLKQANNLVQCICDPFAYTESTDGTLNCVKKTNESCDYGFIYIKEKKSCIEICGDGKNFGMYQCDDGNLIDGDGCSKTCQVEQDFDCKTIDGAETCYYVGVVNIVQAKAYKYPFSNHLLIQCKLEPIKKFFYTLDWKSGIVLTGPKMQVVDSWMQNEWLNINTTYFEDLTGKTLTIKYSSGLAKNKTIRSTGRKLFDSVFDFDITLRDYELPIIPSNNIKPTYFEDQTYETVKTVQKSLFITATCTIVMILAGFALKTVFPFWQLIFALQTIFLSLGVINYMNPLLTGLTEFSVVKGLRSTKIYFESLVSPNTVIEYNIASLGYVSSFFGNMNIMMFIWFSLILTSGALFLMSKKDLTMGFPFQFCKRSLMLLVLFSLMGYSFSVGLITSIYPFEITVASVCGLIIICQLYNLLKHLKRYFHFDRTFDLTNKKVKYIIAMIIFIRIAQALVISLFRTNTFIAACIILAAQALLTVGFVIFRPYTKTLFNILNVIGELTVTGFLTIDLIVNLNFITSIETQNLLSLVQISLNFLIVLLMVGCFIYSIIIDFCLKEKNLNPLNFDDFDPQKSDSFNEQKYKNSSNISKEKYRLKIEDFQDYDNSHVFINQKNSKYLNVSK